MENRQLGQGTAQALKPVRTVKQLISFVHVIVGCSLLGVGILVFAIGFFLDNSTAVLVLRIVGGSLALSGVIELIVATIFRGLVRKEQEKLDRLKETGRSFAAEIIEVKRHLGVHTIHMGYISYSAYAECSYQNQDGKTCLVRSRSFLASPHVNYSAVVHVDHHNPAEYAVEIFIQSPSIHVKADFDYR